MSRFDAHNTAQSGTSLIEVLVTIVITSIGLLGLAGLQARMQVSEVESYQRSQALILLNDMVSRIEANHRVAASYVTNAPLGTGMACPVTNVNSTRQQVDAAQWCSALKGAAEQFDGANSGAMIGGRGCVQQLLPNQFLVTVAWQGQAPISAPPAGVTCGQNLYNTAGTACVNDRCRRAITAVVRIATLN